MRKTKIPVPQPSHENLRQLLSELEANIKGQPEVLQRLAAAVRRREYDAIPPEGCRGAFLFAGSTGVGKTETAT